MLSVGKIQGGPIDTYSAFTATDSRIGLSLTQKGALVGLELG
jgi:hypothetical protein